MCTKPLHAYSSQYVHSSGKAKLVFNPAKSNEPTKPILLPCGKCTDCRLSRSRDWAMRCMHEASLHDENCFITLTYDPEFLPHDHSLHKSEFQTFIRALRDRNLKRKIRYYMCGEYGKPCFENGFIARPHFHACLFNYQFPDKKLRAASNNKMKIDAKYSSKILDEIWAKGRTEIGAVNSMSAAYVARYIMKKISGPQADEINPETGRRHYEIVHPHTGELTRIQPEYTQMSLRPGIGKSWFDQFKTDIFPSDTIYVGHSKDAAKKSHARFVKPPKYYDRLLERIRPDMREYIVENRTQFAIDHPELSHPDRLRAREVIIQQRADQLLRHLT